MQKTDEWLEKYNQETAVLQTQLDKLKSARATDLATYQRIAADVREMEKWVLCNCFVFLILVYSI
jgi:GTP-binding protein EngB required for normal cell division